MVDRWRPRSLGMIANPTYPRLSDAFPLLPPRLVRSSNSMQKGPDGAGPFDARRCGGDAYEAWLFASSTSLANAAGSFTAMSESTFRSSVTPAILMPCMNAE